MSKVEKEFIFLDPDKLVDNDLELILVEKVPLNPEKPEYVPAYKFEMRNAETGERMGSIDLRIGNNENIHYGGHSGYNVNEKFRGQQYAARSLRLLFPFAKKHGIQQFVITCNPENAASRKTAERAGGKLVEIVDLPEYNEQYKLGERQKCRFVFDLSQI